MPGKGNKYRYRSLTQADVDMILPSKEEKEMATTRTASPVSSPPSVPSAPPSPVQQPIVLPPLHEHAAQWPDRAYHKEYGILCIVPSLLKTCKSPHDIKACAQHGVLMPELKGRDEGDVVLKLETNLGDQHVIIAPYRGQVVAAFLRNRKQ